jgi:cyclopropane-fatty-acyl-phospholipid synthase
MTTQLLPKNTSLSKLLGKSTILDRFCRVVLFSKFKSLKFGHLKIIDSEGTQFFGDSTQKLHVTINVHSSSFYSRTLLGGSIGNGESYVDGDWDSDDLTDLVRLFVLNHEIVDGIDGGLGSLLQPMQKIMHGLRGNTIDGSRENIRSHYDIGNDFFKLFLDETMMYSSAIFESKDQPLKEASTNKIKKICESLKLKPTDHLLEIGTGWGSLAIFAALNYGCKVTTTTISSEQYSYAKEQVHKHGLSDQIEVLFEDYRKLTGAYDKLVSVEMIEAVGLDNLPKYFEKCSSLLRSDGIFVIQAITIRDHKYESAKKSVDFIQRHIFPGSGIPAVSAMMDSIKKNTDLTLIQLNDYSEDYAHTLWHWSRNLNANKQAVLDLGYPDFLPRLWQYYFSYCEGGFRERAIGLSQMTLTKPGHKDRSYI